MADRQAVFHLNFRKWPFKGGFGIACGLEPMIEFIDAFHFSDSDLSYLSSLKDSKGDALFENGFLDYLKDFSFNLDIDAMEEGTPVFPYEPLVRVKGPILHAQLLESPILNIMNFQTLIATKAARVCWAAKPDPVIEFGMRRAQGIDGAISATRASYVGGCESTSHVLGGKLFGIPVRGTHAHSWVMAFDKEQDAFEKFTEVMPHNCVLLVDTYNSIEGVKKAVEIAKQKNGNDFQLLGVRLDSGDLAQLSIHIRKVLDEAGMKDVKIMASNELDEYLIRDLKQQGATITIWGVGTNLVTAKDQSALDGVYKLSAVQDANGKWQHRLKTSEQTAKSTNPGILQVRRFSKNGKNIGDLIFDTLLGVEETPTGLDILDPHYQKCFSGEYEHRDLLIPIYRGGKLQYQSPSLHDMQDRTMKELGMFEESLRRFLNPQPYFAGLEKNLFEKKAEIIRKIRSQ